MWTLQTFLLTIDIETLSKGYRGCLLCRPQIDSQSTKIWKAPARLYDERTKDYLWKHSKVLDEATSVLF